MCLLAGRRSTNHSARFRVPRGCPHTPALAAWIKRHNTGSPWCQINLKRTIESAVKLSAVGCVESTVCTRWRETLSGELPAITRQSKHVKTNANSADLSVTHSQSVATWTHLQALHATRRIQILWLSRDERSSYGYELNHKLRSCLNRTSVKHCHIYSSHKYCLFLFQLISWMVEEDTWWQR